MTGQETEGAFAMIDDRARAILDELRPALEALYHERLKGVYLYGSYARGEEDEESDVDVLVVLDRVDRYGSEIERTSYQVAELSLKYGVSVSRVFVPETDWFQRETPFLANVREDAIPA
ncbi:MAG: nucleotidyltransferase domain-containing protein [Dehalococcoidia bacterium]